MNHEPNAEDAEEGIREGSAADAPTLARLLAKSNDLHAAVLPDIFRAVGPTEETIAFLQDWRS